MSYKVTVFLPRGEKKTWQDVANFSYSTSVEGGVALIDGQKREIAVVYSGNYPLIIEQMESLKGKELDFLPLSDGARKVLNRAGIRDIGELIGFSARELRGIRGLGDTLLAEIKGALRSQDLKLKGER